jgi:CheY-like chemotaxis protein
MLKGIRVLLVDDDTETHSVVSEMLTNRGAKVVVATSADEALVVVSSFRPTVIVSDIAMPVQDGYSFIRRVRALGRTRGGQTPALALTALASDEDRRRALSAGFQAHQSKPIDIERLAAAVLELAAMNESHKTWTHDPALRPD